MANLVIDIGNTYTKIAVFEKDTLLLAERFAAVDITLLNGFLNEHPIINTLVSSVIKEAPLWEADLKEKTQLRYFNAGMIKSINNHYRTPQTLGADRLAAVVGAHYLYPDKDNLVIDAGTCITYDAVDAGGNYFGGSISPGVNMRYNALNHYTSTLPLLNISNVFSGNYGHDTATAITSGVQNGVQFELMGFIESYNINKQQLNIVLTGGDNVFFDTLLKNSIFAPYIKNEPYLVLKGLNAAIEHND